MLVSLFQEPPVVRMHFDENAPAPEPYWPGAPNWAKPLPAGDQRIIQILKNIVMNSDITSVKQFYDKYADNRSALNFGTAMRQWFDLKKNECRILAQCSKQFATSLKRYRQAGELCREVAIRARNPLTIATEKLVSMDDGYVRVLYWHAAIEMYRDLPYELTGRVLRDEVDYVKDLLSIGVDINALGKEEANALHHCVVRTTVNLEMLEVILSTPGVDPNRQYEGITPLMMLARSNNHEALQRLVKAPDVDLNTVGKNGLTALMLAILSKKEYNAILLAKAGADLTIKGPKGVTAERMARTYGLITFLKYVRSHDDSEPIAGTLPKEIFESHGITYHS